MRILLVCTGGTIGSFVASDGRIRNAENGQYKILEEYDKYLSSLGTNQPKELVFDTVEPYRILSENLSAEHIEKLIITLQEALSSNSYEGVIITHGTDSLAYTSAALQYVFGGCSLPIVLVSSDYVLEDERANGVRNFAGAVDFICGRYGTGVFVSYCNVGDVCRIHRGNRLQNRQSFSANVSSIQNSEYGYFAQKPAMPAGQNTDENSAVSIQETVFIRNENYAVSKTNIPSLFDAGEKLRLTKESGILHLQVHPGMQYPTIAQGIKAVLYESYHSGTIRIDEGLVTWAEELKNKKIPIYVTGLDSKAAEYETVDQYRSLGLIPLCDRSAVSQYMKLWLCLSNALEASSKMQEEFSEEVVL